MSDPLYRKGDEVEIVRRGVIVEVDPKDPHRFGIGHPDRFGADAYFRTDDDKVRHALVTQRGGEIDRLLAQIGEVRSIHSEFKIYEPCRHAVHEDDQETVELSDGDVVCAAGYQYSACRECCAPGGELTQECEENHDHRTEGWKCSTRLAVDEPAEEESRG